MTSNANPTATMPFVNGRPPHLPCGPGDLAQTVLIPGDPDRVAMFADRLEDVQDFGRRREFAAVTGTFNGQRLSVCSGGIGGPSTEIALVEMAMLGVRNVIRVGGMSALVPEIPTGSYIVADRAIGLTGVARLYAELGYEAIADPILTAGLLASARDLGHSVRSGTVASTDSYYLGQDRPIPASETSKFQSRKFLEDFKSQGAIGVEMETQVIFSVSQALGLKAACLLGVHGNRATDDWLVDYRSTQNGLLDIAAQAIAKLTEKMEQDNESIE
ncbi:MAG: nucleoside phosphorylase [Hyphomicrobiales bacterium]